ncbi:MAG: hypothetical protein JSV65_12630 [Armatimonadota bacterium]|nr:MAG: hypothetical protein JSV65_12630 [Armatimonadota bacterium]
MAPPGCRIAFGALLIGYYEGGDLRYAERVGTGYDDDTLDPLTDMLAPRQTDDRPFAETAVPRLAVHWVRRESVCHVGFTEWTPDGRLRHPRFLGLRDGNDPKDVAREKRSL